MTDQTSPRLPVVILTGFLGAGKTTLLRRVLSAPGAPRYGVLVNDFGEINIDAELVGEIDRDGVMALQNGCVCCTIRDDLVAAIETMLSQSPAPESLLIEASGLSRPLQIAEALEDPRIAGRIVLDATLCLIDCGGFLNLAFADTELAMDQVAGSDLAVLNKTDQCAAADLDRIEAVLRNAHPRLRTLRTTQARVPPALLGAGLHLSATPREHACEAGCGCGHDHNDHHGHHHGHAAAGHHHAEAYRSFSVETGAAVDMARLRTMLRALPAGVLRAKGIVRDTEGARLRFDLVGKRITLSPETGAGPDRSALVFLGHAAAIDRASLQAAVDACLVPVEASSPA